MELLRGIAFCQGSSHVIQTYPPKFGSKRMPTEFHTKILARITHFERRAHSVAIARYSGKIGTRRAYVRELVLPGTKSFDPCSNGNIRTYCQQLIPTSLV